MRFHFTDRVRFYDLENMAYADAAKYISGAQALLTQLKLQDADVPDEIVRVQELVECLDNNAQKIAAALVTNRRRGASVTGADTTAQLLKEQKIYIAKIADLYEQLSAKPDLMKESATSYEGQTINNNTSNTMQ